MSLEDFAKAVVKQAGVTEAKYGTSVILVEGKKDSTELAFVLTKSDGNIVSCTLSDHDDMKKILDSIEDVE